MSDRATSPDPKSRFSSRVDNYIRYRPGYPDALYGFLREEMGIGPGSVVADVGCGTGIFAEPLLAAGCLVIGVEPNAEMRGAAERLLGDKYPGFRAVDGSAEATTLPDHRVDLVACAQAFHWFDAAKAKAEFVRIARRGGGVALVWNQRDTAASPFLADYERLLVDFGTDYTKVAREHLPLSERDFTNLFGVPFRRAVFPNAQVFDFDGLRGRVMSASYVPMPGQPGYAGLLAGLRTVFDRHQAGGRVTMAYQTEVFHARLP